MRSGNQAKGQGRNAKPTTSRISSRNNRQRAPKKQTPPRRGLRYFLLRSPELELSGAKLRGKRIVVVGRFGYAEPQELLVAEFLPLRINSRPVLALRLELVVELVGRLLGRFHHRSGERPQVGAARDQSAQRLRVLLVVFSRHP